MSFLTIFFEDLLNKKIRYCVLRNYEKLPFSTGGSDLDILIHKEDLDRFYKTFRHIIEKENLKVVSFIKSDSCPKYCIMSSEWGLQIDVFMGGVYFGKKEIIPAKLLFNYTLNHNNVKVLDDKTGSLLALLKEILNNKTCKEKYILDLKRNYPNGIGDGQLLNQFNPEFNKYLQENLEKLDSFHIKQLYYKSRKSFKKKRCSEINSKITRFLNQPGYTIAFLGTDGSGKSTVIESIKPVLNDAFHNAVYYEHMRPNRFPSIARLFGKKEEFTGPVTNPHGSSTSGFLGSLFRWNYYLLDYTIGFYLKVWPKKAIRSCVWIFDRYYYDYLIDPKRSRVQLPRWILKAGQFLIPEPDIIICLGTEADLIHKRKPELPIEEVERQVHALKQFCQNHKRAFWIDTGKSIEESSKDALEHIITVMGNRFENVKLF